MPIYEFQEVETGQTVELFRPVSKRDEPVVLKRKPVPSRLGVVAGGTPEPTMSQKLKGAYYRLEQDNGTRFQSGFKANTLKKTLDSAISEGR